VCDEHIENGISQMKVSATVADGPASVSLLRKI